jgi:hypothetical protein
MTFLRLPDGTVAHVRIMWVIWGIDAATRQNVSIDDLLRKNDDSNEG